MTFARLERGLQRIELYSAVAAAVAMGATMLIIVVDVFARYFLHSPLVWAMDLIGMYLMVVGFYAALSRAFCADAHARVDILRNFMPVRLQRFFEVVICAPSASAFALIAYLAAMRAWGSFVEQEVVSGLIAWSVWPSPALVAAGSALMALRLATSAVAHAVTILTGQEIVPLPHIAGQSGAVEGQTQ